MTRRTQTKRKSNKRLSNKRLRKTKVSKKNRKNRVYKRKTVGGFGGVPGCDYLKVEGMNLPGLKIEDQYAPLNSDCTPKPTTQIPDHPNMSNQTK
jgi:hypothetical protein